MNQKITLFAVLFVLPLAMWANNIRVKLNSYNPTNNQLNVTLAWDNSWHNGNGQFRDGAWLFVKYKDVTNTEWQHAIVATPTTPTTLTDTLNSPGVKFDMLGRNRTLAPDPVGSRGYLIRRQMAATTGAQNNPEFAGVYNVAMSMNLQLVLPAGVTLANPEFRVYALEMVDIPAGAFWAGDGNNLSFVRANPTHQPRQITNEAAFQFTSYLGSTVNVQAGFPKATYEYFIMKYELSNEAFAEYLNTLTRNQQNSVVAFSAFANQASGFFHMANTAVGGNITSLTAPATFGCDANFNQILNESNDGQNKGFGCFNHIQFAAYLDWAGLRSLTGFEYEKACRGPLYPVQGEFAWGSTVVTPVSINVDIDGPSESTSLMVDGPVSSNGTYYNTSVRNGCYAKPTGANRSNSGGSYFGVMEMSNGYHEHHLGYGNGSTWSGFTGTLGDGIPFNAPYSYGNGFIVKNNVGGISRPVDQTVTNFVDPNDIVSIRGVLTNN